MASWSQEHRQRRGRAPDQTEIVTAAGRAGRSGESRGGLLAPRRPPALRSGTASFYRLFNSRAELLDRMIDAVLGQHLPPEASGDWREDLAAVARNRRAMLSAHPWLGTELAGRPAIGPNALTHHERALAAAANYSEDPTVAGSAVETILGYVLGAAAREAAETHARQRSGLTDEQWRTTVAPYLQDALNSGSYPHLARMVHEAADLDPKNDSSVA